MNPEPQAGNSPGRKSGVIWRLENIKPRRGDRIKESSLRGFVKCELRNPGLCPGLLPFAPDGAVIYHAPGAVADGWHG